MGIRILDFSDGFTSATTPTETGGTVITSVQDIGVGGEITIGTATQQYLKIQGDGAAVNASITPFGATPPDTGTIIYLSGNDDTNTVTILHTDAADGCILNGDATLGEYDCLTLIYNSTSDRYEEIARNF